MPVVRVEPAGAAIDVLPGETLMRAATRAGYWWPTVCNGNAQCNRCFVTVLDGADALEPMAATEREGLERVRWHGRERPGERLACQLRVHGDAVVHKLGVLPAQRGARARGDGNG